NTLPLVYVEGAQDEVIPGDAIEAAVALTGGPVEHVVIETGWHMLLRDLEAEVVWRDVARRAVAAPAP
ncbi:MAG: alpha/beta hydrolase, partial [Pseudomonadota bacterium]